MLFRVLVLAFALLLAAPSAAFAQGAVGCPGEVTATDSVTASLFGGASRSGSAVSHWCPASGDTFTLTATCNGNHRWKVMGFKPRESCESCTITPGEGANATLSGLGELEPDTILEVQFSCSDEKIGPGRSSHSSFPLFQRYFYVRTVAE